VRAATCSTSPPARAAAAPAIAVTPSPPQAMRESMTSMRRPGWALVASAAAWRADSIVPEIPPAMCTDTTSRPAATSGS
jgi:hypothetical protein